MNQQEKTDAIRRAHEARTHARAVLVAVSPYYKIEQREAITMLAFCRAWGKAKIEYCFETTLTRDTFLKGKML